MLTFPSPPPITRGTSPQTTGLISASPESRPFPSDAKTELTFLKSPKSSAHASGAWRHSHPPVTFSIWDFYFDISEWHILPARSWTPALMLHLTNPCAKRKVLSLTKPKGKIYKTKFLGHYITPQAVEQHLTRIIHETSPNLYFCKNHYIFLLMSLIHT